MDTMKLLLGATVALLLGALAVSWQGMNTGVKNATPDEIARLKSQVAELRKEQDKLALEKQLQQLKANTPTLAPTPTPASNAAEIEAMKQQLEANQRALAQIEEEKAAAGIVAVRTPCVVCGCLLRLLPSADCRRHPREHQPHCRAPAEPGL